jgi:nucleotide-binding universal stress UspA family protein
MYERILVPLDGSAAAERALDYVELLPSHRVRLLQVEPNTEGPLLAVPADWEGGQAGREAAAQAYLERVGARLRRQGRIFETAFAMGDPTDWIIAFAGAADLIVMTTHGRGAGARAMFGSVADRVARFAPIPTLLVRGGDRPVAGPPVARVVVPLDGSALAEQALPVATAVAGDLGVPVHLLRVLDVDALRATVQAGIHAAAAYARSEEAVLRHTKAYLTERAQQLRNRDVSATAEVLIGHPAVTLLEAIGPDDLVVMTTHGRGGVRRWMLGSVADKLVREAAAPVLLVRASPTKATEPASPLPIVPTATT